MLAYLNDLPDLLAYELRRTSLIFPLAQEEFAQERIQGLLLVTVLFASAGILLLESRQEPLQHQNRTLLWIGLLGGRNKDGWVLAPVGAEFGKGGARQDKGRRGQAREVAVKGRDGLNTDQEKEAVLVLAKGQKVLVWRRTFKNAVQLLPVAWGFA